VTILLFALCVAGGPKPVDEFLNSIGVNSAISVRGESLAKTIECAKYLGIRWFRAGNESNPVMNDLLELHRQTGVRFSWGLASGGSDIASLLAGGRQLAKAGALLAFEGNNEPNNWGVTYQGIAGGRDKSWVSVANLQRDLYAAVKQDVELKRYPVWGPSECGAETDNVGLQFLTIPPGSNTIVPEGTKYADSANVHNYIYHPNSPAVEDNKTWNSADPTKACKVDGLYGEYGLTWGKHFPGYSDEQLLALPRVTTETGCTIEGTVTEEIHGLNLLSLYLDQFQRGWSHTAVYLLRDRVDEGGNQQFGFYKPDYSPRIAATYLHNLTTILSEKSRGHGPAPIGYSIRHQPATVHHMLLRKENGVLALVVWSERVQGSDEISVDFSHPGIAVSIYDPTKGVAPIKTETNTGSIELTMSNHPFILEITRSKA